MIMMEDDQKMLKLELSTEDVNVILKALGNLPFIQVFDLIGRIHDQANQQFKQGQGGSKLEDRMSPPPKF